VNNPAICEFCLTVIGRADIEGSKSNVAMNAWLPQASYPYGNFSDTSRFTHQNRSKGSIGHAFTVCLGTEKQNQVSIYPFVQHEISRLIELTLGHLRYLLTDVPPQPNSPSGSVGFMKLPNPCGGIYSKTRFYPASILNPKSRVDSSSGVSLSACASHLRYTSNNPSQSQTRVKLNRVFFPR
jgi:hypothetical protein